MDNKVCIYRHLKPNGEVFYIGIGSIKRATSCYTNSRNKLWNRIASKYGYEVDILKRDLEWDDACELEKILISYYGKIKDGGTLCNFLDGGNGIPRQSIEKMRQSKIGVKQVFNPMKGKKHKPSTIEKMKSVRGKLVLCLETGIYYKSCKEAAEAMDIPLKRLNNYLSGHRTNKTTLVYV